MPPIKGTSGAAEGTYLGSSTPPVETPRGLTPGASGWVKAFKPDL